MLNLTIVKYFTSNIADPAKVIKEGESKIKGICILFYLFIFKIFNKYHN